jgi:hypothetical protein
VEALQPGRSSKEALRESARALQKGAVGDGYTGTCGSTAMRAVRLELFRNLGEHYYKDCPALFRISIRFMRIWIQPKMSMLNPEPNPGGQLNANPYGFGFGSMPLCNEIWVTLSMNKSTFYHLFGVQGETTCLCLRKKHGKIRKFV